MKRDPSSARLHEPSFIDDKEGSRKKHHVRCDSTIRTSDASQHGTCQSNKSRSIVVNNTFLERLGV